MARAAFHLKVQLFDIVCHDEADGIGDAEPYLWPVFFKVDGDSFAVDAVGLIGFPTIESKDGNHGNLGDEDVDEGDRVFIPETLGMWTTLLKPIPVNDPNYRLLIGDDLPGIAGVVVVLMEEDGWPDSIATTGYAALVEAVRLGVAKAAASFQHATMPPSQEEIDKQIADLKTSAGKMVKGAILEYMSGSQTVWYGTVGNNDDTIGTEAWTVNQDDFAAGNFKGFERRWDDDESDGNGDWSITVEFTNVDGSGPAVDTNKCAEIAEQIESLQQELEGDIDINERKRILRVIGQLKRRSKLIGCPQG
jgi:hypothetical protein